MELNNFIICTASINVVVICEIVRFVRKQNKSARNLGLIKKGKSDGYK